MKTSTFKIEQKLNKARKLVLEDIRTGLGGLFESWDGTPTNVTPEIHYKNIVNWVNENIKNKAWSNTKTMRYKHGVTSYGAKHDCERDLRCYVANNWMKMAMIDAGLDLAKYDDVDYDTGRLYRSKIDCTDILTNTVNMIFRVSRNCDMRSKWIEDYDEELEYNPGGPKIF